MIRFFSALLLAILFTNAVAAQGFDGSLVQVEAFQNTTPLITPISRVVGPGVEFDDLPDFGFPGNTIGDIIIDISASTILFDLDTLGSGTVPNDAFNGWVLTDISDEVPAISNVVINEQLTTLQGFDSSFVSFDANSVSLGLQGLSIDPSTQILLDVTFVAVPEPAALSLVWVAGGILVLKRRRV